LAPGGKDEREGFFLSGDKDLQTNNEKPAVGQLTICWDFTNAVMYVQ